MNLYIPIGCLVQKIILLIYCQIILWSFLFGKLFYLHLVCLNRGGLVKITLPHNIFQIQGRDVAISDKYGLALTLGVPERGASTETGVRQGVRPDFEGSEALLRHYKGERSSEELLFPLSQVAFATWWRRAGEGLRYDPGPPHTLRHVGPSHDVMANCRTLQQVRNRGRWRAPSSCLRYAKSHQLIKTIECLPKDLTVHGEEHLEAMGFRHRDEVPRS